MIKETTYRHLPQCTNIDEFIAYWENENADYQFVEELRRDEGQNYYDVRVIRKYESADYVIVVTFKYKDEQSFWTMWQVVEWKNTLDVELINDLKNLLVLHGSKFIEYKDKMYISLPTNDLYEVTNANE